MVRRWFITIPGFLQELGAPCGSLEIHRELRDALVSTETAVELHPWNSNWADVAKYVRGMSAPDPEVYLNGYSWGVGWGCVRLAEELREWGIEVAHANFCDGVYRSGNLPARFPANLLTLLPWQKIEVPDNVRRVTWFRQRNTWPKGHDVVSGVEGVVDEGVDLTDRGYTHKTIDEAGEYREAALRVAGLL